MSTFDEFLAANQSYAQSFDQGDLPMPPGRRVAILTCMDARLHPEKFLGLEVGDAHIIRNAGGLVTDDVIRSLIVSMELLGTTEIIVIEHTRCGLHGADEAVLRERAAATADVAADDVPVVFGAFEDLESNLREQVAILREHQLIRRVPVHGLVFDVATGRLHEVA
jgi:carbonic anhydrase